jgi:hypothetical protein
LADCKAEVEIVFPTVAITTWLDGVKEAAELLACVTVTVTVAFADFVPYFAVTV